MHLVQFSTHKGFGRAALQHIERLFIGRVTTCGSPGIVRKHFSKQMPVPLVSDPQGVMYVGDSTNCSWQTVPTESSGLRRRFV
jgi:hypothetical protein